MTEQKNPSAPDDEIVIAPAVESPQPDAFERDQELKNLRKKQRTAPVLGAIAIVLVIALGAGLYYHGHQQALAQAASDESLSEQLDSLQKSQQKSASDHLHVSTFPYFPVLLKSNEANGACSLNTEPTDEINIHRSCGPRDGVYDKP